MKKTRLLAAVMMLLMIITMFSACGKDKAGNQSGSSNTASTIENVDDVLSKDDIDLAAAGDDAWRIKRLGYKAVPADKGGCGCIA